MPTLQVAKKYIIHLFIYTILSVLVLTSVPCLVLINAQCIARLYIVCECCSEKFLRVRLFMSYCVVLHRQSDVMCLTRALTWT